MIMINVIASFNTGWHDQGYSYTGRGWHGQGYFMVTLTNQPALKVILGLAAWDRNCSSKQLSTAKSTMHFFQLVWVLNFGWL